jgi:hypothetical protein
MLEITVLQVVNLIACPSFDSTPTVPLLGTESYEKLSCASGSEPPILNGLYSNGSEH